MTLLTRQNNNVPLLTMKATSQKKKTINKLDLITEGKTPLLCPITSKVFR